MAVMNVVSNCGKTTDDRGTAASLVPEARAPADKTPDDRVSDPSLQPQARTAAKHLMRTMRVLITLAAVRLAAWVGWARLAVYMGAPWTPDATVRAYVVAMAPEVAGRIVELPVVDNKYVRKGDLLMEIDPTN